MQRKKHLNLHNFRFAYDSNYAPQNCPASSSAVKGYEQSAAMVSLRSLLLAFKVLHVAGASIWKKNFNDCPLACILTGD